MMILWKKALKGGGRWEGEVARKGRALRWGGRLRGEVPEEGRALEKGGHWEREEAEEGRALDREGTGNGQVLVVLCRFSQEVAIRNWQCARQFSEWRCFFASDAPSPWQHASSCNMHVSQWMLLLKALVAFSCCFLVVCWRGKGA